MTDPRDLALQASCPVLAAPRFGAFPEMGNGQRLILAANGVFVQVRLDWLDCIQRIAPPMPLPLPYGAVEERLQFSFGVLPIHLINRFVEAGRQGLPKEVAGVLIYHHGRRTLRLAPCEAIDASAGHIRYRRPSMEPAETVAVDLHTHGRMAPFWSADDDRDDQGIKVAGVFGCLDQPEPIAEFRLVINGFYRPLAHPWRRMDRPLSADKTLADGPLRRILRRWYSRGATPWTT